MEIVSPDLRRLYADWNARAGGSIPHRRDFDAADMRYLLGNISLIDVHRGPQRFFYRVHGTSLRRWPGRDLTGKFLEDAPNKEWAARAHKQLTEVATTGIPAVMRHVDEIYAGQLWHVEVLVLPLSRHGRELDMLIGALVPLSRLPRSSSQQHLESGFPN